jgi:hypothetical protein
MLTLTHIAIQTIWLQPAYYPACLLACANVGTSPSTYIGVRIGVAHESSGLVWLALQIQEWHPTCMGVNWQNRPRTLKNVNNGVRIGWSMLPLCTCLVSCLLLLIVAVISYLLFTLVLLSTIAKRVQINSSQITVVYTRNDNYNHHNHTPEQQMDGFKCQFVVPLSPHHAV